MPRRGGQSMRKRGGSGTHSATGSGRKGHQRNHRKSRRDTAAAWARETTPQAQAVAAVAHADHLTALFTGAPAPFRQEPARKRNDRDQAPAKKQWAAIRLIAATAEHPSVTAAHKS